MKSQIKQLFPRKSTMTKTLIVVFILSLFSTYLASSLSSQQRLSPDNPIQDQADNHSEVPLLGNYLDLVHADEQPDDKPEEDIDDEKESEENDKDDKRNSKNKSQDKESITSTDSDEAEQSNREGNHDNNGNASAKTNDDSPHIEIIDPEKDEEGKVEDENDYFVTSIKDGETTVEKKYTFNIKQLQHDYTLKKIDVSIDAEDGDVQSVSEDYSQPVIVNMDLAKGENEITVAVTYEEADGTNFTVLRNYVVIYDEEHLVIETDLKSKDVTDNLITFKALAKQGKEQIPLTVLTQQGEEQIEVQELDKNHYEIHLEEGKNVITLVATSGDKEVEETVTINYEKPSEPELKIVTDLVDYDEKKVKEEIIEFTAEGYDGDEQVNLDVHHNGSPIEDDGSNVYRVTLKEGKNTFELVVHSNGSSHSETYTVYYEPEATGGEEETTPNERAPEITVHDIKDGETIKNSIRTFHVKVKDYNGNSITNTGNISVTNNGEAVPVDHPDGSQISFTLSINDGSNHIVVSAEDSEGNKATKELTIQGEVDEDGTPIGTATISVDATTVGLGYLIPEQEVEIYQGERASYVVERLLKEYGYDYSNTGNLDSDFYMEYITKPGMASNMNIPEDLLETLEEHNIAVDQTRYNENVLGELDLTDLSGWMYSVNGIYANVGFADYYLKDGDVLKLRFTLAYGNDIGIGLDNFHKVW